MTIDLLREADRVQRNVKRAEEQDLQATLTLEEWIAASINLMDCALIV